MSRPRSAADACVAVALGLVLWTAPLAAEDSRWQVVARVGQTDVEGSFGPRGFGWGVDESGASGILELGYAVHRYLMLQGGYHDLGSYRDLSRHCPSLCEPDPFGQPIGVPDVPAEVDFTGFSLALMPRWPLTHKLWVHGKVGFLDWRGDVRETRRQRPFEDPSDTDLLAGLGAEYLLPRGLGVLLEYDDTELGSSWSAGASWRF